MRRIGVDDQSRDARTEVQRRDLRDQRARPVRRRRSAGGEEDGNRVHRERPVPRRGDRQDACIAKWLIGRTTVCTIVVICRGMQTTAFALLGALALLSQSAPVTKPISINLREGTNMAAALSPDGRTLMIDLQGSLWTLPASGGPAQTPHRRIPRRAPAGLGAGRSPRRVPGICRRRVAHLRDERRRHRRARGHLGSVRRSRAVVVARRQPHRVLVGSIGQLRRLGSLTWPAARFAS